MISSFKKHLPLMIVLLLSVLAVGQWSSCSQYNSESVGSKFYPANSLVRNFSHPVYVEFSTEGTRVWGPYLKEVDYSVDGSDVVLKNASDSLALFVYGYLALNDGSKSTDASITIESNCDYALYINQLYLRSQNNAAIRSKGSGTCYVVLPEGAQNEVSTMSGTAAFEQESELIFTGAGELILTNEAPASAHPVALKAGGGLHCQYDIKLSAICPEGDALAISKGPMRSSLGTWTFEAGQHAISNQTDSIVLIAGSYTGVAYKGKFIDSRIGAVIRQAEVKGLSGMESDMLDVFEVELRYDSVQSIFMDCFETVTVEADSTLKFAKLPGSSTVVTFTPHYQMKAPWLLFSDMFLQPTDVIVVQE